VKVVERRLRGLLSALPRELWAGETFGSEARRDDDVCPTVNDGGALEERNVSPFQRRSSNGGPE